MSLSSIKITALNPIGANIAYTTLIPVVNMAETPTTQKATAQVLGNLILNSAGGSYFPPAAQSVLAQSVTNAAQPNITSVGTLTALTVSGNIVAGNVNGGNLIVANYFSGDGGFLTNVTANGTYSNSNVAAYLPTYTGNVGANVVDASFLYGDGSNISNLAVGNIASINLDGNSSNILYGNGVFAAADGGAELVNGDNSFVLDVDGNVIFEGNVAGQGINRGLVWDFGANANGVNSEVRQDNSGLSIRAWTEQGGGANGYSAPVNIVTNQDADEKQWVFDGDGNLTLPGNLRMTGGNIVSDELAPAFNSAITGITTGNATVVVTLADGVFGDPLQGQVTISDVVGTTEANDTWYYQAVESDQFELYTDNTFTTPVDGTTWTTYVSGGNAVSTGSYSNLTIQGGNISINSNGDIWTFGTDGNLSTPSNLVIGSIPSGNGSSILQYDTALQVIGEGANSFVITGWAESTSSPGNIAVISFNSPFGGGGNVAISTGDNSNIQYNWNFDNAGALTLPGNGYIVNPPNSSLDPLNPNVSTMLLTPDAGYSSQALVLDPTAPGHIHLRAPGANIDEPYANIFLGGEDSSFEVGYYNGSAPNVFIHSGGNTWEFTNDGSTIYPTLTVTRGDRTGTLTGQTLLFGDSTQEAIITTPNGTSDINSSQRFVINPGAGYANTTGEGGDIYLYAGRGGDAGGSGGDIKIRGGLGPVDGYGGYLDLQGGEAAGNGTGGYIDIRGGESANAIGGNINIDGGQGGTNGGGINIQGGYGGAGDGGNINITGGISANGLSQYGNVNIVSGASTWTFSNDGNLSVPGDISGASITASNAFTLTANTKSWIFDADILGNEATLALGSALIQNDDGRLRVVSYGANNSSGPELTYANASSYANINDSGVMLNTMYINSGGFFIDVDSNDNYKGWAFNTLGEMVFPDNTVQTTAWNGTENFYNKTDATGVVVHDCANGTVFYHTSIDGNFTANITNLPVTANTTGSVTLVLSQGATPYVCNAVQINGSAQTILWQGSASAPTGNANKTDIISFSIMRTGASTYIVFGQLVSFG